MEKKTALNIQCDYDKIHYLEKLGCVIGDYSFDWVSFMYDGALYSTFFEQFEIGDDIEKILSICN